MHDNCSLRRRGAQSPSPLGLLHYPILGPPCNSLPPRIHYVFSLDFREIFSNFPPRKKFFAPSVALRSAELSIFTCLWIRLSPPLSGVPPCFFIPSAPLDTPFPCCPPSVGHQVQFSDPFCTEGIDGLPFSSLALIFILVRIPHGISVRSVLLFLRFSLKRMDCSW